MLRSSSAEASRMTLRLIHFLLPKMRRFFNYRGVFLYIPEGVFNPIFALSTDLIIDYLEKLSVSGRVLDLGCGSGIIAIYIAKEFDAEVICSDISRIAIASAKLNAELNGVSEKVKVIEEPDLPRQGKFEWVVINPPYLPLEIKDQLDLAWCGGRDLRFLKSLLYRAYSEVKAGGNLIFTLSSLTGLSPALEVARRGAVLKGYRRKFSLFDEIWLFHFVR
jgi:methylase of polypeptide subunit release factors